MRSSTIIAFASMLALAAPACALAQAQQSPSASETAPAARPAATVKRIAVVELEKLPPNVKSQIDAVVARTKQEDLQQLRSSVDAAPQASSALKEKGMNSSQIVAANLDGEGTLTLIVKTAL
jgi:hypothetical protein